MARPRKRSVRVGTETTSVSLEDEFWDALKHQARSAETPLGRFIMEIAGNNRTVEGRSTAVRRYLWKTNAHTN